MKGRPIFPTCSSDVMTKSSDPGPQQLTPEQGRILLALARKTIAEELGRTADPDHSWSLAEALKDKAFSRRLATFVTLHLDGQLRGCIGTLTACEAVAENVRRNAINAAFQDPRFTPLAAAELAKIDIEVSVLTAPQPLAYGNGAYLPGCLRPGIDGVIIRKGLVAATFLPQVWDQLPHPEDFLARLCQKAGLPSRAWQDNDLEVSIYQVQYFSE